MYLSDFVSLSALFFTFILCSSTIQAADNLLIMRSKKNILHFGPGPDAKPRRMIHFGPGPNDVTAQGLPLFYLLRNSEKP